MKGRLIWVSTTFWLGVLAVVFVPVEAQAQSCDGAYCNYSGVSHEHYFSSLTCSEGGGCKDCSDAPEGHIGCHAPRKTGDCGTHQTCGASHDDETALLKAVAEESLEAVVAVVLASNGRVAFNDTHQAFQIRNCKGQLRSHIPVVNGFYSSTVHYEVEQLRAQLRWSALLSALAESQQ